MGLFADPWWAGSWPHRVSPYRHRWPFFHSYGGFRYYSPYFYPYYFAVSYPPYPYRHAVWFSAYQPYWCPPHRLPGYAEAPPAALEPVVPAPLPVSPVSPVSPVRTDAYPLSALYGNVPSRAIISRESPPPGAMPANAARALQRPVTIPRLNDPGAGQSFGRAGAREHPVFTTPGRPAASFPARAPRPSVGGGNPVYRAPPVRVNPGRAVIPNQD
jgi:hypothetical protein